MEAHLFTLTQQGNDGNYIEWDELRVEPDYYPHNTTKYTPIRIKTFHNHEGQMDHEVVVDLYEILAALTAMKVAIERG